MSTVFFFFLLLLKFIYSTGRVSETEEREREKFKIFYLLVHYPNGHSLDQNWDPGTPT